MPSVITAISYITHLALQQPGRNTGGVDVATGSGGDAATGGDLVPQLPVWIRVLCTYVGALLHLLWLRLRRPTAPQTIM